MNVIVIGATSGIGRAVAEIYIRQGHRVGITGRRETLLQEIASLAPEGAVFPKAFDVSGEDAALRLAGLVEAMGGVDVCLYSSGYGHTNTVLEPSLELGQIDVNAKGFVRCAAWLFNYWAGHGLKGHLAVISSVASILPLGVCPAYSATKKFEAFYAQTLRQLAVIRNADIRITVIKPGFVDTDFIHGRHFPMTIRKEKAAVKIVRAIKRNKKTAVIDGRWAALGVLMRMIPSPLWNWSGRFFRPYKDMF
ncbi:MAG TPA: SDR family NAD(P)-dependent oxidoreductase [Candidatus Coprenecus stercoravium]|uniref:SDR family NAD(P)-dependent oxidoreductase n=1 Tax=Candidatus Coprenecus stercoravium TaxID=2840735 RepID=A0A9D2K8V5_9BACT|nr:SDR family NAD(P)-dependent oxidoreductase [Candidatus Coprenecus stercoravium]